MNKRPKTTFRTTSQTNLPSPDLNEIFIEACASGDYQTVNIILASIKDFNIDVTDSLGRTALRLAVVNENLEVVTALLNKTDTQKLREALLLAIYIGHTQIAELILRHPQYKVFSDKKLLNGASDSFWQAPSSDDAQFSPDITPIMLASQYNRTEIVQMLLLNGDRIDKPHEFHCKCQECYNRFKFDSLRHAQSRLNAYRALASESYISLVSIDPILTAFEIGHELRFLSEKEKYFKNEYLALAEKLSEYTVKLLSNVRGRDELQVVLDKTGKENEEKYKRFARLDLALKYQEMPFVAHPNCQQKLVEIWYSKIRKITKMNPTLSLLCYCCFIFCLPLFSICYIFVPDTKFGRFMIQPCIKFIAYTSSYIILIGLVVISSLSFPSNDLDDYHFKDHYPVQYPNYTAYIENVNLTYRFEANDFVIRKNKPNTIDCFICIWLIALVVYEVKKLMSNGLRNYLFSASNIANAITYLVFIISFAVKFYTMIRVTAEIMNLNSDQFWNKVNNLDSHDIPSQIQVFETFYWLNSDRFYWFSFDPINLSEALYATATILAFCKLCFFLPANQTLGPLQITLGRMINDILKYIIIFLIIFLGFLFALNNLFWYYKLSVRQKVEYKSHFNEEHNTYYVNAELYFGSLDTTLKTMFFSIFLIGNNKAVLISPFQNHLTVIFGYMIFGIFHVSNITVLLNMLIALMTRSYDIILHHSDTEWKFSRSQLYMEFIKEEAILPVPFNLFPNYNMLKQIFEYICKCTLRKNREANYRDNDIEMPQIKSNGDANGTIRNNNNHNHHQHPNKHVKALDGSELTYKKVMQRVVKRFLLHNSREDDEAKESDFDEFKQDVQIARIEMLGDMKRTRENMLKYVSVIHSGISLLGDFVIGTEAGQELFNQFRMFQQYERTFNNELALSLQTTALAIRNQDFCLRPTNANGKRNSLVVVTSKSSLQAETSSITNQDEGAEANNKEEIVSSNNINEATTRISSVVNDEATKIDNKPTERSHQKITFSDLSYISEENNSRY